MSSINTPAFVNDVNDVERFAVLAVRRGCSRALRRRPVLTDRHVVRRHQAADRIAPDSRAAFAATARSSGVSKVRRLPRRRGRQFFEEHRPFVGRHAVEEVGDVFLGHGLEQRLLGVL